MSTQTAEQYPSRFRPNLPRSSVKSHPLMTIEPQIEAEQHVYRFWSALDRRDYPGLLRFLTERCRWLRGSMIEGHVAILYALQGRPSNLTTRHVVNNVIIDAADDGLIARYLLTVYSHTALEIEIPPYDCGSPGLVADITMRCVHTPAGLLIDLIEPDV